jgi:GNAT superfamily N-acetyltransferase
MKDFDAINEIINDGREFLKSQGLPQWQNGNHPHPETIEEDIKREIGFVFIVDEHVAGYTALVPGPEAVYEEIDGAWDNLHDKYVALHRVAISRNIRGQNLGNKMFRQMIFFAKVLGYKDLRIDTYETNEKMKRLVLNNGFVSRGRVTFPFKDGERVAYQLLLD